jgi:hypothetical protein
MVRRRGYSGGGPLVGSPLVEPLGGPLWSVNLRAPLVRSSWGSPRGVPLRGPLASPIAAVHLGFSLAAPLWVYPRLGTLRITSEVSLGGTLEGIT